MNWSISFAPYIPSFWLVMAAIAGGLLLLVAFWTRSKGAMLRALVLILLLAAISNPQINIEDRQPLSDIALLVIDESASQNIAGRIEQTQKAAKQIADNIAGMENTQLRTVRVRSGIASDDDGTLAFAAMKQALSSIPPERFAGTIIITDGQVHDVPDNKKSAGLNRPVHGLISGSATENDRRIIVESAPRFSIVGKPQSIRFQVDQTGTSPDGNRVMVSMLVDGKLIDKYPVMTGTPVTVPLPVTHGGQIVTQLIIDGFAGELSAANNQAVIITEGIRDRLRVLLVSGKPHPGERTWRNLLKADSSVDLVHFTILRPPSKQDGTPINELSLIAFPTRELFSEKLDEFDLVIFDRYSRRGVLPEIYLLNIAEYVKKGGAVLVAAGPDYASPASIYNSPLSEILPAAPAGTVTTEPFRPQVTEQGRRHPVIRGLKGAEKDRPEWGKWFRLIDTSKGAFRSDVVMQGENGKPLLLLSRPGSGRIAQLLSDHSWLWARGFDGGGPQAELLRRMAHWLMKEPDLEEERLTGRQQGKQMVITRQTMQDMAGKVTVSAPDGSEKKVTLKQVKPGLWQARIRVDQAGLHKLSDGMLTSMAVIGSPDPRETVNVHSTTKLLAPVAASTGGVVRRLEAGIPRIVKIKQNRALSGSGWIGIKANETYQVTAIRTLALFGTFLAMALLLGLFMLMWYREGR